MELNGSDIMSGCIAIFRLYYTLYVTGVLYNTSYKHIYEVCPYSTLWTYVALSVIIPFVLIWFRHRNNLGLVQEFAVIFHVYLMMTIWGAVNVLSNTCTWNYFRTTQLFYIAIYNIASNIFGCILILVFITTTDRTLIEERGENREESGELLENQVEI
jgi:hypothetical protein